MPVGQNNWKALNFCLQLLRNASMDIRCQIRPMCAQTQHFLSSQTGQFQHWKILIQTLQLQNPIATLGDRLDIVAANITKPGDWRWCSKEATKPLKPRCCLERGWNVVLHVTSASHSRTITSNKHRTSKPCRNLNVWYCFLQNWDVTLSIAITSASHGTSVRHLWAGLCVPRPQRPACMTSPPPEVVYHIVLQNSVRKPRQCHHFAEALHDSGLQRPACTQVPRPRVGCWTVYPDSIHNGKSRHYHHFGEALCNFCLQKPGCMKFPPPVNVSQNSPHKPQQCRHFEEAQYVHPRQKPGCMRVLLALKGCCSVHQNPVRRQPPDHHFWEGQYEMSRHKSGCMTVLAFAFLGSIKKHRTSNIPCSFPILVDWEYQIYSHHHLLGSKFPAFKGGMLHCPHELFPRAIARPSLRRRTVCWPPAKTMRNKVVLGQNPGTQMVPENRWLMDI